MKVILFADDTNYTALSESKDQIQQDLNRIATRLKLNKLSLNLDKTCQMNVSWSKTANDVKDSYIQSGS